MYATGLHVVDVIGQRTLGEHHRVSLELDDPARCARRFQKDLEVEEQQRRNGGNDGGDGLSCHTSSYLTRRPRHVSK